MSDRSGWAIRPSAQDDLHEIWRHGASEWGVKQADAYLDGLFGLFDLLAAFPELARERHEFSPPVRIHPCRSHLVIYRLEEQGVEIVRVIHARQDFKEMLQD